MAGTAALTTRSRSAWLVVAGTLAPAVASAACAPGTACEDAWLWRYLLPGTVVVGLATWVLGPLVLALVDRLRPGKGPRR